MFIVVHVMRVVISVVTRVVVRVRRVVMVGAVRHRRVSVTLPACGRAAVLPVVTAIHLPALTQPATRPPMLACRAHSTASHL